MDHAFLVAYLIIDLFCSLFALIILSKAADDMGSETEVRTFRRLIYCYLFFVADDALWCVCSTNALPLPHWVFFTCNMLSTFAVALVAFYWFDYASSRMGVSIRRSIKTILISQIPLLALVLINVLNVLTRWVFSIDETGAFVQGPLYPVAFFFEASYLLPVAYMAIRRLISPGETSARHREDLTLVSFIVLPTLGGLVDAFAPGLPVMTPSLFASILYVFVSLQESRIFNDALTGLNNRRRADAFLADRIARASEGAGFWFFLSDVDSFKLINDEHGHLEGDHALCVMANALRMTASAYGGFTARWGGDEFVLVVDEEDIADPRTVVAALQRHVQRLRAAEGIEYRLEASVGYARCASAAKNGQLLLAEADSMLYEHKREVHHIAA